MSGIRLVAFDLDGTLTRGRTCLEALVDAYGFAGQTPSGNGRVPKRRSSQPGSACGSTCVPSARRT
ncbi:HAD family hydrolase [Luedemannella flava]